MAVDSSIPLGVRQVQLPNQLAQFAQVQQIQGMQQQNRLADLQFQRAERQQAQETAVADAYRGSIDPSTGQINRTGLISSLAGAGQGATIPGIQKTFSEQDKATREAEKARLEQAGQQISLIGQVAGSSNDPQSYAAGRARLAAAGVDVSQIPEQYDPAYVANARQQALTAAQQLEQVWKSKEFDLDQQEFGYRQQNDAANRGVQIRGQDMSASTAIRGQNMVDSRSREANASGRAPSGYRWSADGSVLEPIPGGPAMKDKAPTEFQGKSATFGSRAAASDQILNDLERQGVRDRGVIRSVAESVPFAGNALGSVVNTLPSGLGGPSPQQQQVDQARRDFVNAVLRQESGAAIGQSEFDNASRQYFPQPGDSPEVIAQKAANRKLVVQGFQDNAGPAGRPAQAPAAAPSSTSSGRITQAAAAPAAGTVQGGYRFKGGNPADQSNWERM